MVAVDFFKMLQLPSQCTLRNYCQTHFAAHLVREPRRRGCPVENRNYIFVAVPAVACFFQMCAASAHMNSGEVATAQPLILVRKPIHGISMHSLKRMGSKYGCIERERRDSPLPLAVNYGAR